MDESITEVWENLLPNQVRGLCCLLPNQSRIGESVTGEWEQPLPNQSIIGGSVTGEWECFRLHGAEISGGVEIQMNPAEFNTLHYLEKEDPSTQVGLLDSEDKQVQDLVFRFRRLFSIPYRESLANSLLSLFDDAKEEDPTSIGMASGSLRNLYNLLQLNTNLKCPIISLTPDYNIYASWRKEHNQVFSVHFLPNGDTRFVILKPNNNHPGRQICLSGLATTDILMEMVALKPFDVSWISE